ncbi:MAG: choice-of-anchor L domain-containing protein [Brumimicrobium sp.]
MKHIFQIFLLLISLPTIGQLQTSGGMSPTQLVQNVLLGQGVEVSNVSFSGSPQAIGTFNATNVNNFGINEGIIITTGTIHNSPDGPHGPNNRPDAGLDNGKGGYPPLTSLVGNPTFNASVLEFDFIPLADSIGFNYIFASEEYPEYVGSEFNDVFAFFISGPGISGTKNMATIPGTSQPVTINNVNHNSNSAYYQANGNGTQSPYNQNSRYIQYDGYTKSLTAWSKVQCGEKYHLVIAIADVSDPVWDSGIFLEKNSLNSEQPVQVSYELTSNPYGDGQTMAQNCTSAIVTIKRSGNKINEALTIPINFTGTSIENIDHSSLPTSITFQPGESVKTFTIDALYNPALVGVVDLLLEFEIKDACGNDQFQYVELYIKPVDPVEITLNNQSLLCPGEPIELIPTATGGGGEYSYLWSTGETTPTINVSPSVTTTYTVSVTDECLNETATTSAEVTVPVYDPITLDITEDIFEDCPYIPNVIYVTPSGGSGMFSYVWTNEEGTIIGIDDSLEVLPSETTTYYVEVTDHCGEVQTAEMTIHILSDPLLLDIIPVYSICPGDSIELTVSGIGGFGDYYYYWVETGDTTQSIWVSPDEDTRYHVIVKDDCQTFQVATSTLVKVIQPIADFEFFDNPEFIGIPVTFQNLTEGGIIYEWDFGDGQTSTLIHPNNTYKEEGSYEVTLIATDRKGCKDTITKLIIIQEEVYLYVPNTFTPDGNSYNNTFSISTIGIEKFEIKIFDRWGELIFEAFDKDFEWDGTYGHRLAKDGTYLWKMIYSTVNEPGVEQIKVGHINLLR